MKQLEALYAQWKGEAPRQVEQLPGAGSNRLYYRMTDAEGNSAAIDFVITRIGDGRCRIESEDGSIWSES